MTFHNYMQNITQLQYEHHLMFTWYNRFGFSSKIITTSYPKLHLHGRSIFSFPTDAKLGHMPYFGLMVGRVYFPAPKSLAI